MRYQETSAKLADYRRQITDLREKMRAMQAAVEPEEVRNYELAAAEGPVRLADLFGSKADLFVIHNMGASCPYCTVWADGFNGIYPHVADRAAFVVSSPDQPVQQRSFAAGRGWRFPMVSHTGSSFAADMGYRGKSGGWMPGVSVFKRDGDRILRVADTSFQPGDDFCALWHFLDLMPGGKGDWEPDYRYG
jgi:predicted dithiol-disulfide oxidoreductase (DUF899 family)